MRNTYPRAVLLLLAALFTSHSARGQITNVTDDTSTPIAGAGHDYIHLLNETVNPANGSISVRINVPVPRGRGLTLPFSFAYDSNGVHHLVPGAPPHMGQIYWTSNQGYLSQGGWFFSAPMINFTQFTVTVLNYPNSYDCNSWANYVFSDPTGGRHALGLGTQLSFGNGPCQGPGSPSRVGEDSEFEGTLPNSFPDNTNPSNPAANPVTVFAKDGTMYSFPTTSHTSVINGVFNGSTMLASSIEDRNGNLITGTDSGNGVFSFLDTAGRTVISTNGFGPSGTTNTVTVGGLAYHATWKTVTSNYTVSTNQIPVTGSTCVNTPASDSESQTVISQITLPNGQSYKFFYGTDNPDPSFQNPYGLLSEIDYPDGGSVKYKWGLPTGHGANTQFNEIAVYPGQTSSGGSFPDGCLFQYQAPVVISRTVSFGGSSAALTQTFSYTTAWSTSGTLNNPAGTTWTSKSSSVTTADNVTGKSSLTSYSYSPITLSQQPMSVTNFPGQVPVESQIQYFDWGNTTTPLRTVNKTWYDMFNLASEQTVLENFQASKVVYCYAGNNCNPTQGRTVPFPQLIEKDDYDFGASTPTRKTLITYQSFSGSPGIMADRPCRVQTQNSSGTAVAETDYLFDGGTTVCGASGSASTTLVSGLPAGTHDETLFAPSSSTPRGNTTNVIRKCLQSCSDSSATYAFDETGQVLSKTDPCGNAPCSDMTGTNHTTTYSYTDSFDSPPSGNTNAYLTKVTDALGHFTTFKYAYADGQLISSTDQNGLITSYLYNEPLRRLTETDRPDGGNTKLTYSDTPPSPSVTSTKTINSAQSVVSTVVMDGLGHTVQTQVLDPKPPGQGTVFTVTTYDGLGRVKTVSNPYRSGTDPTTSTGTTTYFYDALGRKCLEVPPDGTQPTGGACPTTQPANDLLTTYSGNTTTVTDQTHKSRKSVTDALGRLTQVFEDPAGLNYETDYLNDALGNLLGVNQRGGTTDTTKWRGRSFTYDSLSRLLTSSNPEVGTITYTYDADSNVSTKKDARNITTTYGYDALSRLKSKSYSNGEPTISINYDEANCLGLPSCQNVGQRTSMTDAAGSEAWSYQVDKNNLRTVHANQRTTNSTPSNITKSSTYYMDLAGNLASIVYPSGRTVNYNYDNAGRPSKATDASTGIIYAAAPTTPLASCPTTYVCYAPQGSIYSMSLGQTTGGFTGLNISETFNSRLQPNEIKVSSTGGNAMDLSYNFVDPTTGGNAGHVNGTINNLDTTRSQTFTYDQLNRISSAQTTSTYATSPTHCWAETYQFDGVTNGAWGNLTQIAATTNSAYSGCSQEAGFSWAADGNNHLSAFIYDAGGNATGDSAINYSWNAESQITYSSGGANYYYDGDGRRVYKANSNAPKLYWYSPGGEILSETSPAGYLINDYIYFAGKRIAAAPNDLNLNGGFEQGLTNWSASGSGTAAAITNTANAHSGNGYVEIITPAGGAATKVTSTQLISAQKGETVTAGGWVYREVGGLQYSRWWMMVNGSNGFVGGHPVDNTTMNAWVYEVISTTVPSWLQGPYTVTIWAEVDSTSSTQATSARFDDVTLNGNLTLFAGDLLGTSRVVTDGSGIVCYDGDFYPYGGERAYTNTCDPVYKFEGKERDTETGNDDFGSRYYSNRFGRWLSADWSAKPEPVPYANLNNPQTLNLYAMVSDDPESFDDLDGHCDVDGEHHWGWCIWHTLGLYETRDDRVNDARNFFNNNAISINGQLIDPSKLTNQQVLDAFKIFNDVWRENGGAQSPTLALSALLPGAGLKYESNPKHGASARGIVSAEPTNPQQALENSVPIKNTSAARVAVDPSTGEYVMFRAHGPGVFHGYATKNFNDLPNEAKAALQEAGLVSKSGKLQ